jgi:hypothetical protein
MTTATRTCTFYLSAWEEVAAGKPVNATQCGKEAIAKVGQTMYRCETHYVDLLAAKPQIDMLGYVQGVNIWEHMEVVKW